MRKILITVAAAVMSVVMCFSSLAGCNLITVDSEKDMNQVVAAVQIHESAPLDKIYKKDMVMAYLNYGYMYEQYYGYTSEQTFTEIINSLVKTRIFVQNAMIDFNAGQKPFDNGILQSTITDVWNIDRYLSDEDVVNATYSTIKDINVLIHSYEHDHEAEKFGDSLAETVRTTPTNAANEEKELSLDEKKAYINETGIDSDSTESRRAAYNKVVELLRVNSLLGAYDGDLSDTDYYKETLNGYKESRLIERYEDRIEEEARSKFDWDYLQKAYKEKYEQQQNLTSTEFTEKLSSATASDPILVGVNGTYGYVYNLLLGASETQTSKINELSSSLTTAKRAEERRKILEATKVKDQRSTWLLSGYDFDINTKKFTGDYTFTTAENSLAFQGEVTKLADATDESSAEYRVDSVKSFGLSDFVDFMENYVYGAKQTAEENTNSNSSIYKKVKSEAVINEYSEKINELLFAFSTDPGSLNTYKGYAIKPVPDGADAEDYMQEFADAGRELLTMGGTSYIMVATDYGYHVMFYSEKFTADYGYESLTAYLNAEYGSKDWAAEAATMLSTWEDYEDTDNYLYLLCNSLSSTAVSNAITKYQNRILNKYIYEQKDTFVKFFTETYQDLLG